MKFQNLPKRKEKETDKLTLEINEMRRSALLSHPEAGLGFEHPIQGGVERLIGCLRGFSRKAYDRLMREPDI